MNAAAHSSGQASPPVAILSWEMNPMVAGGSWTACYHFVRKLKEHGLKPVVVTPWRKDCVDQDPFDCGVSTNMLGVLSHDDQSNLIVSARGGAYRQASYSGSTYGLPGIYSSYGSVGYGYCGSWSYGHYGSGGYGYYRGGGYGYYGSRGYGYGSYAAQSLDGDMGMFFEFMKGASELYSERLMDATRRRRFGLIHAQDWVTFNAAARVSRAFGIPWIAHFHSLERDRRPWAPDVSVEQIERNAALAADFIITPSRYTARRVTESYGIPASKILAIPNVLSHVPAPKARGDFSSKKIVFLGRLEFQKGPDRFASMASLVQARDEGVSFCMFGDGALRDYLIQENPRIKMNGPLTWNRRWSALDGASALIVPSRAEPFGMVVLEAMQCGVPVLFTDEAGVAEVISSGVPIQAEDIQATADRVLELMTNAALWERIAHDERQEIHSYPERNYERELLNLYANLSSPH